MHKLVLEILSSSEFLFGWLMVMIISIAILVYDLRAKNSELAPLMKWVWIFTVLYSGLFGLAVYFYSGRKQIKCDSLWRRSFRSVAHCYSGCGAGEIAGVFIALGLFSLGNYWVMGITFVLAYISGYILTVGPLLQEGVDLVTALKDAFYSETVSITVMELTAIGIDLWLARNSSGLYDPLFWSSLVFSLSAGLVAAYPVNVVLIRAGIKKGMHNPKNAHNH